jgi:hypothetical protein
VCGGLKIRLLWEHAKTETGWMLGTLWVGRRLPACLTSLGALGAPAGQRNAIPGQNLEQL